MTHSQQQMPIAYTRLSAGDAQEPSADFEYLDINEAVTRGRDGFLAFEVTGDSMVPTIAPGSLVFVDPYAEPRNGDIIVASVGGKISVKLFEHTQHGLRLVPVNAQYRPQPLCEKDEFLVVGVVRAHLALY